MGCALAHDFITNNLKTSASVQASLDQPLSLVTKSRLVFILCGTICTQKNTVHILLHCRFVVIHTSRIRPASAKPLFTVCFFDKPSDNLVTTNVCPQVFYVHHITADAFHIVLCGF